MVHQTWLHNGAYSTLYPDATTPSFILLAVQGPKVVTYVYELKGDQVRRA